MKLKHAPKMIGGFVAALVAVAIMAPAASATTPAPGYGQFAGCPTKAEFSYLTTCLRSEVKSGRFKLGNKEVPITTPIVLSGGVGGEFDKFVYNSKGGMPPVKQKVPGGVVGLTGLTWLLEILGSEALTLYSAAELAGTPTFKGFSEITLPLKFHLINSTLGNNCYVGSTSNPVVLHLTVGKSGALTGTVPSLGEDAKEILHLRGGTYVDGLFTAPEANGCVLTLFGFIPISINGLVDAASGLPAGSGTNETVQNIETEFVETGLVYP
jgi:hypothetical protein